MDKEILTNEEIATLKAAKKVLAKIDKQIQKLEAVRAKTEAIPDRQWPEATNKLMDILDFMYKKAGVTNVGSYSPSKDYLILQYD